MDRSDNEADGKDTHAKAGFSTYNVTSAGAGAGDTSDSGEEANNITTNTGAVQLGGVGGVGGADKGGVGTKQMVKILMQKLVSVVTMLQVRERVWVWVIRVIRVRKPTRIQTMQVQAGSAGWVGLTRVGWVGLTTEQMVKILMQRLV